MASSCITASKAAARRVDYVISCWQFVSLWRSQVFLAFAGLYCCLFDSMRQVVEHLKTAPRLGQKVMMLLRRMQIGMDTWPYEPMPGDPESVLRPSSFQRAPARWRPQSFRSNVYMYNEAMNDLARLASKQALWARYTNSQLKNWLWLWRFEASSSARPPLLSTAHLPTHEKQRL